MQKKDNQYTETLQRYCHVINANTTLFRTSGNDGVFYSCKGCEKAKNGACVSKDCFMPCANDK